MQEGKTMTIKVVFCGQGGVGKKSLTKRQTSDVFFDHFSSVVGLKITAKEYLVHFWNLDGGTEEPRKAYLEPYYHNTQAICLCFVINNPKSFPIIPSRLQQQRQLQLPCPFTWLSARAISLKTYRSKLSKHLRSLTNYLTSLFHASKIREQHKPSRSLYKALPHISQRAPSVINQSPLTNISSVLTATTPANQYDKPIAHRQYTNHS